VQLFVEKDGFLMVNYDKSDLTVLKTIVMAFGSKPDDKRETKSATARRRDKYLKHK